MYEYILSICLLNFITHPVWMFENTYAYNYFIVLLMVLPAENCSTF